MELIETIKLVLQTEARFIYETITTEHWVYSMLVLLGLLMVDFARRKFKPNWSPKSVSGTIATLIIVILNIIFVPVAYFMTSAAQTGYDQLGIPHLPTEIWSHLPAWALAIFAVMAFDFANYWNHRAMHHHWLWPIHAIHHSDETVNGSTVFRVHILEIVWMKISFIFLLSWLGLPPSAVGGGAFLLTLHGIYVHLNLDWDHGPFKLLVASPRYHRWHHADVKEAYGKNLANIMPLYDYLFGTYYMPGTCRERLGAEGVSHDDPIKLMLYPFVEWAAMIKRGLRKLQILRPVDKIE
ncbi:MAG: sterol desaturase family protein [Rhizobiaceae bacterium]